jgi:hypothetical protein
MRPTYLQFRNPKERTPDPYDIRYTSNGSPLALVRTRSPSFGREKRFKHYEAEARKTGYRVGPGSYSSLGANKIRGGCVYKPLYAGTEQKTDCFYVGQLLVRDSSLTNSRFGEVEVIKKVDGSRPTTASDAILGSPHKGLLNRNNQFFRKSSRKELKRFL